MQGSLLQFVWKIDGLDILDGTAGLELAIIMPAGFQPVSKKLEKLYGNDDVKADENTRVMLLEGTFAADTGVFTIPLAVETDKNERVKPSINGRTAWSVDWQAEGPFVVKAEVRQNGQVIAAAELPLEDDGLIRIPKAGGRARQRIGGVSVEFPDGALAEDAGVRIRPARQDVERPKLVGGRNPVEIVAEGAESKSRLRKFDSTITIRLPPSGGFYPPGSGNCCPVRSSSQHSPEYAMNSFLIILRAPKQYAIGRILCPLHITFFLFGG